MPSSKQAKYRLQTEQDASRNYLPYGTCFVNRQVQHISNFIMEPLGLIFGKSNHPKRGKVKKRVLWSDMSLNIGVEALIPAPSQSTWKEIAHNNHVTWSDNWVIKFLAGIKMVCMYLSQRLETDRHNFDLAGKLMFYIPSISQQYISDWQSSELNVGQRGIVLHFLDILALRLGNEKDKG